MTPLSILYVSSLCSEERLKILFSSSRHKQGLAAQKFHRLIVEGLKMNGHEVSVLSALQISRKSHPILIWRGITESFGDLKFHYLFFINIPLLRHFFIFIGSLFFTFSWCFKVRN